MKKIAFLFLYLLIIGFYKNVFSIDVGFESGVPKEWNAIAGVLSTSDYHFKEGQNSLRWDWNAGDQLVVVNLQAQGLVPGEVEDYFKNTFRMWFYNTRAIDGDSVVFEFYDQQNNLQYFFPMYLGFQAWRAASISYRYEMFGPKGNQNLYKMVIKAPTIGGGTFFIDYVDFSCERITSSAPSNHLPYKRSLGDNHWSNMIAYDSLPKFFETVEPSEKEKNELQDIEEAFYPYLLGAAPSSSSINTANSKYNKIDIHYNPDGSIKGLPLFGGDGSSLDNITIVNDILLVYARDYIHRKTSGSKVKFMELVRYTHDQGYNWGSVLESVHHIGYDFRDYPLAVCLMKDELIAEGLWQEAFDMITWFVALNGIWEPTAEVSNMDAGNTRTIARFAACLAMNTQAEQVQYLKGLKKYFENWASPYPQLGEGIKTDYTGFHHNFYYPARYVASAYKNIAFVCQYLKGSTFDVNTEDKEVLKKAILVNRILAGTKDLPMSVAGRGPVMADFGGTALAMKYLALSYNEVDEQLAAAYNLIEPSKAIGGIAKETPPEGFWQLNYAPMGVYRHEDWVADIKGFNNYFAGAEIYSGDNQYGRYQSYGALEVIYSGGNAASGKSENGWNWNATPGATTIHMSWTDLKANGRRDETTDAKFVGALRFGNKNSYYLEGEDQLEGLIGLFAMDFQQKDLGPTHNPSFKFRKSVFCIDGKMICLGTGINNNDTKNTTTTNLFQVHMPNISKALVVDGSSLYTFPYESSLNTKDQSHWMIDPVGTGVLVKEGQDRIVVAKTKQYSPKHTGQGNTSGNFATSWIDHGKAPENKNYEFMVIPNTSTAEMFELSKNLSSYYEVLMKQNSAHIIRCDTIEAYALFESNTNLTKGYISGNSSSCLAITKYNKIDNSLQVSVNDPALLFGSNGLAISEELKLIFNGAWTLKGKNSNVDIFEYGSNSTTFILRLYNGEPVDFTLEPNDIEMQTLITVNDAFLEGERGFNTNLIRTEPNEKKGYLMFDISKIKSTVFTTNLQLHYFGTTQDASLVLSLGDSNNWDEFNLSIGNAPKVEHVLDSLNTTFISGNVYRFSIPSETLIEKDTITFIIEQINGDKMGFASKENTANGVTAPTLILMKSKSIDTSVLYPSKKLQEFNIVYPNPFQSSFSLKNDKRCQLTIFTLNGKKLFSTLVNSKAEVAPDYEIIPPGTYLIKLNFFDGIESGKIIRL